MIEPWLIVVAVLGLLAGLWIGRLGRGWVCVSCSEGEQARKGDGERLPVRDETPGISQPRPVSPRWKRIHQLDVDIEEVRRVLVLAGARACEYSDGDELRMAFFDPRYAGVGEARCKVKDGRLDGPPEWFVVDCPGQPGGA